MKLLAAAHKEVLKALVELYEEKKDFIKGDDIANYIHRSPGTIRNQMLTLGALGFVSGVPGPKGGYKPTKAAYSELGIERAYKPKEVHVYQAGKNLKGLYVRSVSFVNIDDPAECQAVISVLGNTTLVDTNRDIMVGPTPLNHIILKGTVTGRDDVNRELIVKTESITSVPRLTAGFFVKKGLIAVTPGTTIKECAELLMKHVIDGVPVVSDGKLEGIVTVSDIIEAFLNSRADKLVCDIEIKKVHTVERSTTILDCIGIMKKYDIGRLIIVEDEKPIGILTRTDIILRMIEF